MIEVFLKILVIFMMIGAGFAANKAGALPKASLPYLVNLLLIITSPCMIISSMAEQHLTPELFSETITVLIGSILYFIIVPILSVAFVKLMKYEPVEDRGVIMVLMTAVNTGFMGFPVTRSIFGDHFLYLMVIQNIILNVYMYFLAIFQMNHGHPDKSPFKEVLKSAVNLCTIAAFCGLVILFGDLKLPGPIVEFMDTVGGATIPLSMVVVGVQLAESEIKQVITNKKLILASLINIVVVPALTFLAVNWLPISVPSKVILVFAAAFPCAVAVVGVAAKEKKNASLLAEGVALTTIMSLVSLPVISYFLISYYNLA